MDTHQLCQGHLFNGGQLSYSSISQNVMIGLSHPYHLDNPLFLNFGDIRSIFFIFSSVFDEIPVSK